MTNDPKKPLVVGNTVDWLHGDKQIVVTILEIEADRVKVSGMYSDYWLKKTTLLRKLQKANDRHELAGKTINFFVNI